MGELGQVGHTVNCEAGDGGGLGEEERGQSVLVFLDQLEGRLQPRPETRVLHSHWSRASECCLRQQSYAIKNQLGHPKPPNKGGILLAPR